MKIIIPKNNEMRDAVLLLKITNKNYTGSAEQRL